MSNTHSQVDPAHRVFVSYIDKSREYYLAQGFGNPYRWACNEDSPFAPLPKPLAECRVGLVTTASLPRDDATQEPYGAARSAYAAPIDPPPSSLFTMDLAWDKEATHTDDLDSFFPARRLHECAAAGRIRDVSPRFYGVPTEYSQHRTTDQDAPRVLDFCRQDGVDVALLVAL